MNTKNSNKNNDGQDRMIFKILAGCYVNSKVIYNDYADDVDFYLGKDITPIKIEYVGYTIIVYLKEDNIKVVEQYYDEENRIMLCVQMV